MNVECLKITQSIDLPVDDLVLFPGEAPLEGVDLGLHFPALLGLHDQPVARGLPLPLPLPTLPPTRLVVRSCHLVELLVHALLLHVGLF